MGLNVSEARQLCSQSGLSWPRRGLTVEELEVIFNNNTPTLSKQTVRRRKTERFVQDNWPILKDELTCKGNCGNAANACSDAQAFCCFKMNEDLFS